MRDVNHPTAQGLPRRSALSLALLTALCAPAAFAQTSDDIQFDTQAIQARGVDPKITDWFRQSPRFMPGETNVTLTVNGSARGKVKARFGNEGQLCVDNGFIHAAQLMPPPGFKESDTCFDLKTAWPQTEMNLDPGEERIDLVLPPQAVARPGSESGNWSHGGFAGLFNYDAQYMDSAGSVAGLNFMQLGTESGFNIDDWIIRSRETFSRFNGTDTLRHQAAYAQRSFTESKKVLQAGQISLSNSLFGTGQVLGFQMFPEAALQGNRGGAGLVEGIAESQSVVEVRQSGALVYSTTVPAGPFRLQGFPLINTRTDLNVTITGSSGEKRTITVPASALLLNGTAVAPGFSFGVGKLDQQASSEAPLVGTLATGWALTPSTVVNIGALGSPLYRASALAMDTQPFNATVLSVQATAAEDTKHSAHGVSLTSSLMHNLTERISVNVNASQQTVGYRELSDALQDDAQSTEDRNRSQYGGGVSWTGDIAGGLSLSWARSTTFRGDNIDYLRGSWSKQFGSAYVGASLEHDTGTATTAADNRLYVTVNVPFGSRTVSTYFSSNRNNTRGGIRYSDRTSQDRSWSVSSERDFRNQRTSNNGTLNLVTPVSMLSGSVSRDSNNYTSWSARATGGVVAHDEGVTLSAYRVSDTFGIAKVGGEAGVRLETPAGPTWTDSRGYAVLPSLSGYKHSMVQVDTRSLPKNVDIGNSEQETEAARGSVSYVTFDVIRTRRVLLDVKNAQGQPLLQGSSVFDTSGNFVTVVGENGSVFIPDANITGNLDVQSSGKTICSFPLSLPEKADTNVLYETAKAVCR